MGDYDLSEKGRFRFDIVLRTEVVNKGYLLFIKKNHFPVFSYKSLPLLT